MSKATIRTYERFPLARRIEHWIMMLSFTTLALTGLPQRFSSSPISIAFVGILGGIENLRTIHHIAAIVMMLGTAWHLLVFGYLAYVRRTRLTMLPTLQDAKDGWQALLYNIGRAKTPPQLGRYSFEEKMEYWAFVWGAIIMGATGFMMWNPITTARFLPGEVIPAAKAAHGGEALLAVLAIIVWHMYGVHIKRFNRAMFTGKMTEEEMLHEHPLELADIKAGIADRPVDDATLRKRQRAVSSHRGCAGAIYADRGIWVCQRRTDGIDHRRAAGTHRGSLRAMDADPRADRDTNGSRHRDLAPHRNGNSCSRSNSRGNRRRHSLRPRGCLRPDVGYLYRTSAPIKMYNLSWSRCLRRLESFHLCGCDERWSFRSGDLPGDSANSLLVTKQQAGGHPGQLTPEEIAQVIEWIDAGAPEN